MSELELLQIAHESQRDRLNSELSLFWNRISVLSVAIVGIAYSAGALLLNAKSGLGIYGLTNGPLLVFAITCVVGLVLSWTLCGAVISGMYWVRINEEKLQFIEKRLFGFSIYEFRASNFASSDLTADAHRATDSGDVSVDSRKKDCTSVSHSEGDKRLKTWPVTSYWQVLGLVLTFLSLFGIVASALQHWYPVPAECMESGNACIKYESLCRFLWSAVISILLMIGFWFCYFKPQSERVWRPALCHSRDYNMYTDKRACDFAKDMKKGLDALSNVHRQNSNDQ